MKKKIVKKMYLVGFVFFMSICLSAGVCYASPEQSHEIADNALSVDTAPHWGYEGNSGPANWGILSPDFSLCSNGVNQSPINIERVYSANFKKIDFKYNASPLKVINNGHTIEAEFYPGSKINVDGKNYDLVQFHFHTPSEHKISGISYNMEMHLVHKNENGEYAVIAILMKKGRLNTILQTIWDKMPIEPNTHTVVDQLVNIQNLLPNNKSFYHYRGSLTTPPCSESVSWYIFRTPIEISEEQAIKFSSLFQNNARPVQTKNRRFILYVK